MSQLATIPAQREAASRFESLAETRIDSEAFVVDEFARLARAHAESQAFVSLLAHELRSQLKAIDRSLRAADPDTGSPYVMWSGTPYQHLMAPIH